MDVFHHNDFTSNQRTRANWVSGRSKCEQEKQVYLLLACANVGAVLWKLDRLGFRPTTASNWFLLMLSKINIKQIHKLKSQRVSSIKSSTKVDTTDHPINVFVEQTQFGKRGNTNSSSATTTTTTSTTTFAIKPTATSSCLCHDDEFVTMMEKALEDELPRISSTAEHI